LQARDPKADLQLYLQEGRNVLLWKLDGLSSYDARRPMTPTGTNLLGLVKHVTGIEADYLGTVFGRPFPEPLPWLDGPSEPNADLWATVDELQDELVSRYQRVSAHADATIAANDLETVGRVPWWPEGKDEITLHRACIHVLTELHRHAGHADLIRERIDGAAGLLPGNDNLPDLDQDAWRAHHERLERVAREVADAERGSSA
jgi:hypothetical protein